MKIQDIVNFMIQRTMNPSVVRFGLGFPIGLLAFLCLLNESAISAVPKDFIPDATFTGSAVTGWHTLGQAGWRAEDGEIIGTPTQTNGGWLMLDKGYQDIQIYASFRSTNESKAGLLLRAEKTPDGGMKGIFVSLSGGDNSSYNVVLDAQGNELSRTKLGGFPGDALIRMATAVKGKEAVPGFAALAPLPPASEGRGGGGGRGGGAGASTDG